MTDANTKPCPECGGDWLATTTGDPCKSCDQGRVPTTEGKGETTPITFERDGKTWELIRGTGEPEDLVPTQESADAHDLGRALASLDPATRGEVLRPYLGLEPSRIVEALHAEIEASRRAEQALSESQAEVERLKGELADWIDAWGKESFAHESLKAELRAERERNGR